MKILYKHSRTGNLYIVEDEVKLKIDSMWYDAILYKSIDTVGEYFVRLKSDFNNKFTKVNEDFEDPEEILP